MLKKLPVNPVSSEPSVTFPASAPVYLFLMIKKHPSFFSAMLASVLLATAGFADVTTDKPGQFVRIELPKGGILTLAEVEILSGGKNIAKSGKPTQSSLGSGGVPERAIDGNKSPSWGDQGQTHTSETKGASAWWEIDLGNEQKIEAIEIWNRADGLEMRLDQFKVSVLDAKRQPVFMREGNPAPDGSIHFDLAQKGKITLKSHSGAAGKAAKAVAAAKSSNPWESSRVEVPEDYRDPEIFEFQTGDTVAMIGNALGERMQHHGWLETLLQSQFNDKQLRFRNLAISGDRTDYYPRNKGFLPIDGYLQHVEADVVFVFFGYNESYENNPEGYTKKLNELVHKIRAVQPNGKSFPRIVLFSPIAHEELNSPNLPNGSENNVRLAAYTEATKAAAEASGVTFVDLFHPSQKLYEASEPPLTINGVHLNLEGNRLIAEAITEALTGQSVNASADLEPVREAVLYKNTHWFDRYRAVDGNDIWGSRSTLKFVGDQTNGDVLMHEMVMLDVMTANRDKKIWARANGDDHDVLDENVPAPIPVISNVGGKGNMSSAEKEGSLKYLSSEESRELISVPEGFQVNVFADEKMFPDLVNPVQMQVDAKGRLWVAAWPTYPKQEPMKDINDALLIFEDVDQDGVADKVTKFANIPNPLGFEFWGGGVIVSSQPNLVFLRDTDGDDIADEREILLHGVGSADTHHACNNLIFGPDGGIYWQSGIFLHNNFEHPWGPSLSTGNSAMYRFNPRTYEITMHGTNSPNPHGISFDRWGYHYATDGTGGRAYQVRPDGKSWKMFPLLKKEVRPVPANEIVSSAHFPDEMQQDFLICNAIGFLGIKQYRLHRDGGHTYTETVGKGDQAKTIEVTTQLGEVWGEPSGGDLAGGAQGLLISTDKNFRPTDAVFGDDGALYVSDWANVIIGHMQHNIRDPNRDKQHGRVFRVSHASRPLQESVKISRASLPELMTNLEHPVDGVRHRTRIELSARDTQEVIAAVQEWTKQFDPNSKDDAHHLLEALWVHQQHNVRNGELLAALLQSPEPHAQVAARTVQHFWYNVDSKSGGEFTQEIDHGSGKKSGVISDTADLLEIRIKTLVEKMRYDFTEFSVRAGKNVKVTFENPDFMPHNLLFVQPKSANELALAAMAMGQDGFKTGFVPTSDKVIAATRLLDNGEEQTIEFTAPSTPGTYEFVCTFPGHHLLMRGTWTVTK